MVRFIVTSKTYIINTLFEGDFNVVRNSYYSNSNVFTYVGKVLSETPILSIFWNVPIDTPVRQ